MTEISNLRKNLNSLKEKAHTVVKNKHKPSKTNSLINFFSNLGASFRFILSEKENILFAFLQWAAIGLGYYLWVQVLSWIPEEIWQDIKDDKDNVIVNIIFLAWSFLCVGLVAYPLGILTACMGASYMLRSEGRDSTIAECLNLVMRRSGTLWVFSWLDGWWTVERILERLPKKNDRTPLSVKLLNEAVYQAWKAASLGFIPALLYGRSIGEACSDSLKLVKNRFIPLMQLRIGYSIICWLFGIGCYIGVFFLYPYISSYMSSDLDMYGFYFMVGFPMLLSLTFIMLVFRPVYIISACRIYTDYAQEQNIKPEMPSSVPHFISILVTFTVLLFLAAIILLYRNELGIEALISNRS